MAQVDRMSTLGSIGEKIISNYLISLGKKVEVALNPYDNEKDLKCDGKSVEVKTQVPFIMKKAFSFKKYSNNLKKCRSVDDLYFIAVPAPKHKFDHEGWLFHIDPKTFRTEEYKTKGGLEMILIPIDQEAVTPIHKIDSEITDEMMKYTSSDY